MPERSRRIKPRPENPFSTRYTRPGALPFLVGSEPVLGDGESLIDRWALEALRHPRSAVVGPHGTGKSTLLAHLRSRLEHHLGRRPAQTMLHIGEPATQLWAQLSSEPRGGTLIVDGYEQLSLPERMRLIYRTRQRDIRLIVTAHRAPRTFYVLAQTGTPRPIARRLAMLLLDDFPEQREAMLRVFDEQWPAAQGNIRQLWGTLYEHFEQHLSTPPATSRRE